MSGVVLANEKELRAHFADASKEEVIEEMLSLVEVSAEAVRENARLRAALELVATPKRSDGTYNRDREACEVLAREALKRESLP